MSEQKAMNPELKSKWVEALRSGKYQQTVRCLRDDEGTSFCCLGVLADIKGASWDMCTPLIDGKKVSHPEGGWLDEDFFGIPFVEQRILSRMNDSGDAKFPDIADYIEAKL